MPAVFVRLDCDDPTPDLDGDVRCYVEDDVMFIPAHRIIPADQLRNHFAVGDRVALWGKPGTVIFLDTEGLRDRVIIIADDSGAILSPDRTSTNLEHNND